MTRRTLSLVVLLLAVAVPVLAAGTLIVSPANLQGWTISPDGTVPYSFTSATAATGTGSLQFGPISGANPANKFIMLPPVSNLPMSQFVSLYYAQYIDPASLGNSANLYSNVYIDQAANGIGTFAGGTGFYDCRYDFAASSLATPGVWQSTGFSTSTTPIGLANRTGTCSATLGGLAAADQIRFITMNGGQSTSADAGLMGGFDNVVITTSAGATTYDFEPLPTGTSTTSALPAPIDSRINGYDAGAPIAAYAVAGADGTGLVIYGIDSSSRGFLILSVSAEQIAAVPAQPAANTLIADASVGGLTVSFWRLTSGQFQINATPADGKTYVLLFNALTPGGGGYTSSQS